MEEGSWGGDLNRFIVSEHGEGIWDLGAHEGHEVVLTERVETVSVESKISQLGSTDFHY
jgi:hypothetical protein